MKKLLLSLGAVAAVVAPVVAVVACGADAPTKSTVKNNSGTVAKLAHDDEFSTTVSKAVEQANISSEQVSNLLDTLNASDELSEIKKYSPEQIKTVVVREIEDLTSRYNGQPIFDDAPAEILNKLKAEVVEETRLDDLKVDAAKTLKSNELQTDKTEAMLKAVSGPFVDGADLFAKLGIEHPNKLDQDNWAGVPTWNSATLKLTVQYTDKSVKSFNLLPE